MATARGARTTSNNRFKHRREKRDARVLDACSTAEAILMRALAVSDEGSSGAGNTARSPGFRSDFETFAPPFLSVLGEPCVYEAGGMVRMAQVAGPELPPAPSRTATATLTPTPTPVVDWRASRTIDWATVPASLDPAEGELAEDRANRKRMQVEAVVRAALPLIDAIVAAERCRRRRARSGASGSVATNSGTGAGGAGGGGDDDEEVNDGTERCHVVDFGSGSGHVGLLLAWLRPCDCFVTLLERKAYGCDQATRRAAMAWRGDEPAGTATTATATLAAASPRWGLHVRVCQEALHVFAAQPPVGAPPWPAAGMSSSPPPPPPPVHALPPPVHAPRLFDLGVSLHSCGLLTDGALEVCCLHGACFALCPCCYGQITTAHPVAATEAAAAAGAAAAAAAAAAAEVAVVTSAETVAATAAVEAAAEPADMASVPGAGWSKAGGGAAGGGAAATGGPAVAAVAVAPLAALLPRSAALKPLRAAATASAAAVCGSDGGEGSGAGWSFEDITRSADCSAKAGDAAFVASRNFQVLAGPCSPHTHTHTRTHNSAASKQPRGGR